MNNLEGAGPVSVTCVVCDCEVDIPFADWYGWYVHGNTLTCPQCGAEGRWPLRDDR